MPSGSVLVLWSTPQRGSPRRTQLHDICSRVVDIVSSVYRIDDEPAVGNDPRVIVFSVSSENDYTIAVRQQAFGEGLRIQHSLVSVEDIVAVFRRDPGAAERDELDDHE